MATFNPTPIGPGDLTNLIKKLDELGPNLIKFLQSIAHDLARNSTNDFVLATFLSQDSTLSQEDIEGLKQLGTSYERYCTIYRNVGKKKKPKQLVDGLVESENFQIIDLIQQKLDGFHQNCLPASAQPLHHDSGTSNTLSGPPVAPQVPRPLQILPITLSQSSYKIDLTAINYVLDQVADLPLIVYSMNGSSREGKSYMLNNFIRYLKSSPAQQASGEWLSTQLSGEFSWRGGSIPVTAGINLWSEPFIVNRRGRQVAILLLDCQGLFDPKTTQQQNSVIFALSNLLSSVMIYNVKTKLDEHLIEKFDQFSQYTKAIALNDGDGSRDDLIKLMILVRDFEFSDFNLGHQTQTEGEGGYLEATMKLEKNSPAQNRDVRQKIRECFHSMDMYVLPHPGKKFVKNPQAEMPDDDFLTHSSQFVQFMNSEENSHFKRFGALEVTGQEYKRHVTALADLWNQHGNFPPVELIGDVATKLQNEMAMSAAMDLFQQESNQFTTSLQTGGSVEDLVVQNFYESIKTKAINLFKTKRKLGGQQMETLCGAQLEEKCKTFFENCVTQNEQIRQREKWEEDERQKNEEAKRKQAEFEALRKSKSNFVRARDTIFGGRYKW